MDRCDNARKVTNKLDLKRVVKHRNKQIKR